MTIRPAAIAQPRIRWRIFSMLLAFATCVYFQQRSITVAAERIMPELSLTQMQIGWLQWAFVLSYACLQFPGGIVGQRIGARRALTGMMLLAVAATAVMPLTPWVMSGTVLFVALFASQFLLGVAHAPFMPVCAGVMEAWLPPNRWALAQGLHTFFLQAGAGIATAVLVPLIALLGWQSALFWTALPPLAIIALWYWYGRDTPREHGAVSEQELAELSIEGSASPDSSISLARVGKILASRDILLLTLSYISMNYVFYLLANWCFLYLVQERHFATLEGGVLASLPPFGAALGAGLGGWSTEILRKRFGVRWGYRLIPLIALPMAGALLLGVVYSANAYLAALALTLAYGSIELTEGAYWASTMRIAQADTMAATGVLNTGGNIGGIIGIPIVAYLSGHQAWNAALILGTVAALVAAGAWFGIDASRPMATEDTLAAPPA